uniref:Fimbrial protein n=1 Tax=Bursaphelenchus xylophilus TaxID=6326 RepID=A0A1I7S8A8_BURXY
MVCINCQNNYSLSIKQYSETLKMLFKILLTVFLLVSNRSSADTGISGVATCHGRPVNVFVELEKQGVTGPVTLNSMPSEGGNFTIATWRAFEEDKTYYLEM